jgi:nitrite reductase/ring-hydroxylating ferredoxin subunit
MYEDAGIPVCRLEEIPDGGSRGFTLRLADGPHEIFLVRSVDRVYAYQNRCPHTGAPLDWVPDRFLSLDGRHIQCATHAALFRIEDGACLAGPCNGQGLASVPVNISGGVVRVDPGRAILALD